MASLNRIILIGNLTRDPELRFTPNGTPVANFGLAVNRRQSSKQTEGQQTVDFFNIVAWGRTAELCGDFISKGSPVAIEGRLQARTWQGEDGQKRNAVEVVAENVQFLSGGGKRGGGGGGGDEFSGPTDNDFAGAAMDDDIPF